MKRFFYLLVFLKSTLLLANDGSFYGSGNQLIPTTETNISVKKEILTLKKIRNEFIDVTVYYEFYNPGQERTLTVGFEAFSPKGDVDGTPKNGLHPYMNDFTVQVNNDFLKYHVAYVNDSAYIKNGLIKSKSLDEIKSNISDENYVDFYYVYYFKAVFKSGLNIIKHTYTYRVSSSIENNYDFEYILTAANRWGNKQIDDFTLILEIGDFETYSIAETFFKSSNDWLLNGVGKVESVKGVANSANQNDALNFHIRKGTAVFQKKNFKPAGEIFVYSKNYSFCDDFSYLPFSYYQESSSCEPKTEFQRKILKNLPFARRGYIFQSADLKSYFEKMNWYIPNPNYQPDIELLEEREKKWIEKWK